MLLGAFLVVFSFESYSAGLLVGAFAFWGRLVVLVLRIAPRSLYSFRSTCPDRCHMRKKNYIGPLSVTGLFEIL